MRYLLASFALAAGCSSGPQYGSPHAPNAAEMSAVSSLQSSTMSVTTVSKNNIDANAGATLFNMPLSLAGVVTGTVHQNQALHTEQDFSTCSTVTQNSVTYNNCQYADATGNASLNGSLSWSANSFMCDINAKYSASSSGISISGGFGSKANISWTSSSIDGTWSFDENFSESVALASESASVNVDVNYEKIAWDGNGCITSGTLEVIVKASGNANGNNNSGSGAIKATWTACNTFTVQTATTVK